MSMLEVNVDGWIAQNKGRSLDELLRELIQNAMDTGTDVYVGVDANEGIIIVEDEGDGYSRLEDAWQVFGGDKGDSPDQRGRFGRGQKEILAAVKSLVIETTSGRVEFDVPERERTEDRDFSREVGTKVVAKNSTWDWQEMHDLREYLLQFRPPEGQQITVDLIGGKRDELNHEVPDHVISASIPTVVLDESTGAMEQEYRQTNIEVDMLSRRQDGKLYEMGIPVKTDCEFSMVVDVQQKIPMAEQRNEPDSSWYDRRLKTTLVEKLYETIPASHKQEDWYASAVNKSYNDEVKEDFIDEVVRDKRKRGIVTATTDAANDKAKQHGYQVFDDSRANRSIANIVKSVAPTATEVARDVEDVRKERVSPTGDELDAMKTFSYLAEIAGYDIDYQMWEMEAPTEGRMKEASHADGIVRLNRLARDWDVVDEHTIGTAVIHEVAHEESSRHDDIFEDAKEEIAGVIIDDLLGDFDPN